MINQILGRAKSHPELVIVALMVMIIAMLIIPLPTILVDFLIGLNMVISVLVFLSSFYVDRILHFSTFPSVLLITTLFRLAISISTSRLILMEANAGEIIATFGRFVIGDSLAVGFVVFSIVTVVQFIVITKGSERVAEVAARFSLDGMPGKQMSIDADLKAGIIDSPEARLKRSELERESQLYGAFDGAMKFIKGDAIASIIIIFVNMIGGITVGISQHNMSLSSALSTYTILTIGDGLVAQIPALLISISAGFIVTRVSGDSNNMGINILNQMFGNPFVIVVTACIALGIGALPGFPVIVFVCIASLFVLVALRGKKIFGFSLAAIPGLSGRTLGQVSTNMQKVQHNNTGENTVSGNAEAASFGSVDVIDDVLPETTPLMLLISERYRQTFEQCDFSKRFTNQFFLDYGIHIPALFLSPVSFQDGNTVTLYINEVSAAKFDFIAGMTRVIGYTEEMGNTLNVRCVYGKHDNNACAWISAEDAEKFSALGYQTRNALDELYFNLSVYIIHNITEIFGIQETKTMLDQLEMKYPEVVREVLRYISVQRVAEVFQRLLVERISVRNMKMIMESLAMWAPREKDIIALVEHIRGSLSRYICQKFTHQGELRAVILSADTEERLRRAIKQTSAGSYINFEPEEATEFFELFNNSLTEITLPVQDYVIITSVDIRRYVKRIIESKYPELEVISYGEITEEIHLDIMKTIN